MSKNSNKKQLNSRLNNVFTDIDKPVVFPGLEASSDISGWIWEMTPTGVISGCSPDIEIFLEIPSHKLIGSELMSFSDFSFESANLPSDPNRAMMPTTISINFRRDDGSIVPTTTYFLGKLDEDNTLLSWRGITSVLGLEEPRTFAEEEPKEAAVEESIGLITLDDVPEIPQPDESVMDIWAHNEEDTSPLTPQDLITNQSADENVENVEGAEAAPQDDIETIRYTSSPVDQQPAVEFSTPEIGSEEPEAQYQADELELETEIVDFSEEAPITPDEIEETIELPLQADEPAEIAHQEVESFYQEIQTSTEAAPQDEIETIHYTGSSEDQEPVVEFSKQEIGSEEPEAQYQAEDEKPETEEVLFSGGAPVAPGEVEETAEFESPPIQTDSLAEIAHNDVGSFSQELQSSEKPPAWIPEFASPGLETAPVEEPPTAEQPEPAPQDEIETIRYSSYPVSPDQITPTDTAADEIEQTEASLPVEAEKLFADNTDLTQVEPEFTEAPTGTPEFSQSTIEELNTFIPLGEPSGSVIEEEAPVDHIEPAEPTHEDFEFEMERPASEEPATWTPEYSESPVEDLQAALDTEDLAQPAETSGPDQGQPAESTPTVAGTEAGEMDAQSLEIDEIPTWTPPYSEEPLEEPQIVEAIQQPTFDESPGTEAATPVEDTEEAKGLTEIVTEPLDIDPEPTLASEYQLSAEEPHTLESPPIEETKSSVKSSREPDTQPIKPFGDEPVTRVDSVSLIPDLDLQKEELERPTEEGDTDALDPFPELPNTGRGRRPMIDTASLIPSLLSKTKPTEEKDTDSLSIEDFLQEVEKETVRIETKELQTLTSADGIELSISRGVQELLKIVDDSPNREWKEDELQLVEQVHTQLELALENANLFQQTQIALSETDERARQLRLLNQMSEEINQTDDLLEIYGIVTDKTIQIFNGQRVSITILTEDRTELEVVAATGDTSSMPIGEKFPLEKTSNEIVIRENRVFIPPGQRNLDIGEIKSTIVGPIAVSNNVIGTLNIGSNTPNAFNDRDANFLTQLLSILNASVENRRLFEQIETALSSTEEQARRLAVLNQLSEKLTLADSFDQVITLVLDYINQIIPADEWAYTHVNEEKNTYELFVAPDKLDDLPTMDGSPISLIQPLEDSIVGKAAKNRRTIIEFNCLESQFNDVRLWAEERGVRTAMSSPLVVGNRVLGVLNVGSTQQSAYTIQEENIMLSITSLAGSTIDNRQLLGQIQKRSVQLETSAEVSRVASTMLDPAELLPRVVELIKEGFDLYYAGIFLIDDTGEITGEPGKWAVLRAGSGEAGQQMIGTGHKLEVGGESMIGTAISTSQARIALSVGEEARFFRNPFLPNTRSEMALPLTSRGEVLGALSIQSENEDAFNQEDITALQTMADQLANAIENARLFEQTEMRAEELTVLNEMARGFTQTMDVDELIENTYKFTGRLMEANNFYLVLYYPEEQFYEFKLFVEDGQQMPPPRTRVKLGDGLTDWIINNKLPVLIPADPETHLLALGIEPRDRMPKSWLGVPMLLGNDVSGVIAVQSYNQANTYSSHSLDLLIAVSSQAAVAIDNARRFQATQTRARHEEILRRVTTQVHSTSDPEAILRTAVREVSDALGKPAFVKLNPQDKSVGRYSELTPAKTSPNSIPSQTPPAPQPPAGAPEER